LFGRQRNVCVHKASTDFRPYCSGPSFRGMLTEQFSDDPHDVILPKRFEVNASAKLAQLPGNVFVEEVIASDNSDGYGTALVRVPESAQAFQTISDWQVVVQKDSIRAVCRRLIESSGEGGCCQNDITVSGQHVPKCLESRRVVVDDEDSRRVGSRVSHAFAFSRQPATPTPVGGD